MSLAEFLQAPERPVIAFPQLQVENNAFHCIITACIEKAKLLHLLMTELPLLYLQ